MQKSLQKSTSTRSQKWDRLAVPFFGPHAQLSKRTKEKHFHGPIFGTVWRYQKWDRKIAKSTAKADPCNKQKITTGFNLSNQHIDLEQRRPAHAKPDFNWLSAPKNGTWKRTCGISCLRSLAPMWRLQCSTTQATYNTRIKFFLLTSYSNLTGLIWITWRIADQLLCFEIILLHSDLKYAGHAKWG